MPIHMLEMKIIPHTSCMNKDIKATKKKPTQKAPARVARPGTANQVKKTTPLKKSKQKLAKSGKIQDAAKVFEQLI